MEKRKKEKMIIIKVVGGNAVCAESNIKGMKIYVIDEDMTPPNYYRLDNENIRELGNKLIDMRGGQ